MSRILRFDSEDVEDELVAFRVVQGVAEGVHSGITARDSFSRGKKRTEEVSKVTVEEGVLPQRPKT